MAPRGSRRWRERQAGAATVKTRFQREPAFAEALLDEAINHAARGDSAMAKRILRDLIEAARNDS